MPKIKKKNGTFRLLIKGLHIILRSQLLTQVATIFLQFLYPCITKEKFLEYLQWT